MLGFPILYCKGMRPMMFQLSGFYCKAEKEGSSSEVASLQNAAEKPGPLRPVGVSGSQTRAPLKGYYKGSFWGV